ncbi:MAG: hypothetical protein OEY94_09870 [Alphaproteobacteria bacterium]|nr:hypothetical protein [Alphaproteobacteria bacterium]
MMDILTDSHSGTTTWYIFSFLIFAYIVWKYAVPALNALLDSKIEEIKKELEVSESLRVEAQEMLAQYQRKHRDAVQEAETIVKQAKASAEKIKEKAKLELEETMARREAQLAERLKRMEDNALAQIQIHAANLAVGAANQLISDKLDKKINTQLIDQSIDSIENHIN